MEDTPQLPGTTGIELVLSLDGFTILPTGANRTVCLHVITTPLVNISHAVTLSPLPSARIHAHLVIKEPSLLTDGLVTLSTASLLKSLKFKLKF
jgi:hypothetical protein